MHRLPTSAFCLSLLLFAILAHPLRSQPPTFATGTSFNIPMSDGTTRQAIILPGPGASAWLVTSSPTTPLGFWTITPTTGPTPTPPLDPPKPTPPPDPPKPAVAAVVTISEKTPAPIGTAVAAELSRLSAAYHAFTIAMVAQPTPPENALTWIGRSAGKPYPYTFIASADGRVLWEGPTPGTSDNFLSILRQLAPKQKPTSDCPTGNCQPQKVRRR